MTVRRRGAAAVLLADGRVLMTGGQIDSDDVHRSSEIYDPATETWTAAGDMSGPRKYHTATLLNDGRVLVAGGVFNEDDATASADMFDPQDGSFSPAGDMSVARGRHAAVLLEDGRVLILGGLDLDTELDSAEIFDPLSGTFTSAGAMTTARESLRALKMDDGRVLITGGVTDGDSSEIFDPTDGMFRIVGPMSEARDRHIMAPLGDGRFLVAGGRSEDGSVVSSADIFDSESGQTVWTPLESGLATQRFATAYASLPNGNVLVCGGFNGERDERTCEIFDVVSNTFTEATPMSDPRGGGMAVAMLDSSVLVCGGAANDVIAVSSCDRYR